MKPKLHITMAMALALVGFSPLFVGCEQAAQPERTRSVLQPNEADIRQYSLALENVRQKMCPSVPIGIAPSLFADACSKASTPAKVPIASALAKPAVESNVVMPDLALTPGLARSDATAEELCAAGFSTRPFRHTTAEMKREAYAEYQRTKIAGVCCEVDHLIPLELGGADDKRNLWAQPYSPTPGAHEKDLVENYLHKQVCAGNISLSDAQRELTNDWFAVYQQMSARARKMNTQANNPQ